jgi:hypothetical protein
MTLVDVWYLRMLKVSLIFDTHVGFFIFCARTLSRYMNLVCICIVLEKMVV